jgi:glycerol-3-phosphate dehydrogenase
MTQQSPLRCSLGDAASRHFDIIIVGGGIYGAMLALEAGLRAVPTLLVERDDFASHTSSNNLRILHGGLRHLQNLDLVRYYESVAERRWYMKHFPELTRPLTCIMPLRGTGLQRRGLFKAALALNDALSVHRNAGVPDTHRLPAGRVIDVKELDPRHHHGLDFASGAAALWHDGLMISPQRILVDVVRWAASLGVAVANYASATAFLGDARQPSGIVVEDRLSGDVHEFQCRTIIDATGRGWAEPGFDGPGPARPEMTLAWNLGLAKAPFGDVALGATSHLDHNNYFLVPWGTRVMVGTAHDRLEPGHDAPTERQIEEKLAAVRAAFPGFRVDHGDVVRVFSGLLPGRMAGNTVRLDKRPTISIRGKAHRVVTVNGVKFTTARRVADAILTRVSARHRFGEHALGQRPPASADWDVARALESGSCADSLVDPLLRMAVSESAHSVDDLLYRRTTLGDATGSEALALTAILEKRWPVRSNSAAVAREGRRR